MKLTTRQVVDGVIEMIPLLEIEGVKIDRRIIVRQDETYMNVPYSQLELLVPGVIEITNQGEVKKLLRN